MAQVKQLEEEIGEDFVGEIIYTFLQDLDQRMSDFRALSAASDLGTIRTGAHTLKSTSRMLGLNALADMFLQIETGAREGTLEPAHRLKEDLVAEVASAETSLKELRSKYA